jgi:hypothetical protein
MNIAAIGFDINPALVVVSRARLLGAGVWASIDPLGADVVDHAASVELDEDPLCFWFTQRAASSLRGLQQSVHRLLVDSGSASQPAYEGASGMSTLAAFFYTVLFRTLRVLSGASTSSTSRTGSARSPSPTSSVQTTHPHPPQAGGTPRSTVSSPTRPISGASAGATKTSSPHTSH